ncbi:MAG: KamA family radical SAM protein [Kiritimatiellaceae bacterium]|nr:KamA family radical SAM protein [Kiritimatiellaceae bacterium]
MNEFDTTHGWKWQIANRISTRNQLEQYIDLTVAEQAAFDRDIPLSFSITPHYVKLLGSAALRATVIPSTHEHTQGIGELADPLDEEDHRVAPHLIHTYPDKVLFLATTFCSTYCRYCTRSRLVGESFGAFQDLDESFQYIEEHTEIRDVLISGGDPLTLSDLVLDELLTRIREIPHVRTIRIGSKVPVVLPMRITDELCTLLRRHHVWLSLHFIHVDELSDETKLAGRKLADHGISMVSQTVLLKNINDDVEVLTELFYGLLEMNVKPYYLLQCDPVRGSAHFRTPVEKGIELIRALHGNLSGLAVPQYVIDAPGGGGKVPILSTAQIRREGDEVIFLNYEGREYRYPDPA